MKNSPVEILKKNPYRLSAMQNVHSFDPFADASEGDDLFPADTED